MKTNKKTNSETQGIDRMTTDNGVCGRDTAVPAMFGHLYLYMYIFITTRRF